MSIGLHRGANRPDAFCTLPDSVPRAAREAGAQRAHDRRLLPAGAKAWRTLYTTTRDEGRPAVASGLVIAAASAVGAAGTPAKVLLWAHGTPGGSPGWAPSILARGLGAGAMFVQDKVLGAGWAMVAADYLGLGTAAPHP